MGRALLSPFLQIAERYISKYSLIAKDAMMIKEPIYLGTKNLKTIQKDSMT